MPDIISEKFKNIQIIRSESLFPCYQQSHYLHLLKVMHCNKTVYIQN